jgi:hypothetical protein
MTTPIPFKGKDISSVEFEPFTVATLTNGMEVYLLDYMTLTDKNVSVRPGEGWFSRALSKEAYFYSYAFASGYAMGLTPFVKPKNLKPNHVRVGFFSRTNGKINFKFLAIPAENICPNNYMLPETIPEDVMKYSIGWKDLQKNDWLNPDAYYFLIEGERAPVQIFDTPSVGTFNILYADNMAVARTCKVPEEMIVAFFREEDKNLDQEYSDESCEDLPFCSEPTPIPTPFMRESKNVLPCVNKQKDS